MRTAAAAADTIGMARTTTYSSHAADTVDNVLGATSTSAVQDVGQIGEDAAQTPTVLDRGRTTPLVGRDGDVASPATAAASHVHAHAHVDVDDPASRPGKERRVRPPMALLEHPPLSAAVCTTVDR